MNKRPLTVASLNVRGLRRNSPKQKKIRFWISSLVLCPSNIIPTRTPHGGIRLLQLHKNDPILKWQFFLKFWPTNGALIENECEHFHSHEQIPCPLITANGILLKSKAQFITL
jgi:hypothetical protein